MCVGVVPGDRRHADSSGQQTWPMVRRACSLREQEFVVDELLNRWDKRWVGVQTTGSEPETTQVDVRAIRVAYGPIKMTAPRRSAVGLGALHVDPREERDIVLRA